jgi:alanine-synthesizing transaminase
MFAWAPIPVGFRHLGSVEFAKRLMEGAEIAVAPGAGFGEYGDGFVRLAFVENENRIRQAARNLKRFLQSNAAPAEAEPSGSQDGEQAGVQGRQPGRGQAAE